MLQILLYNTQSLRNKICEIESMSLQHNLLIFSEHWLDECEASAASLAGFEAISYFARKQKRHGGVIIFVDTTLHDKFYNRQDLVSLSVEVDCEVCAIQSDVLKVIVVAIYRSPAGSIINYPTVLDKVLKVIFKKSNFKVFIGGD